LKIYGKTLKEIFEKLPLPYKALVCSGVAFLAIIFIFFISKGIRIRINIHRAPEIVISNLPKEVTGQIYPSITSDDKLGIMAFSAQTGAIRNVRLLKTLDDTCSKWSFIDNQGIEGKSDRLVAANGEDKITDGMWSIETPSIVYDPDDTGKEWKLFAYKYFWSFDKDINKAIETAKKYSVITYKYSSSPTEKWSSEKWIFSPNQNIPPAPYNKLVQQNLNDLSAELANATSYSRPSVIYQDGILLMALSVFTNQSTPDKAILIASEDHGNSWIYLGSPIGKGDSQFFDNALYKGSVLIQDEKNIYLATTFGSDINTDDKTYIMKFKDPGNSELYRERTGKPIAVNEFDFLSRNAVSGGFPAYNNFCKKAGIIISERNKKSGEYKLFITNKNLIK